MSYSVESSKCAEDFLKSNEDLLLKNESFFNLKLGIANRFKKNPSLAKEALFFSIQENGLVIAQPMITHQDKPIILSDMDKPAIEVLISFLRQKLTFNLTGVVGPSKSSQLFSDLWNSNESSVYIHLGVYESSQIDIPTAEGYTLKTAENEDKEVSEKFISEFIRDCFPNELNIEKRVQDILNRHMTDKTLFLLINSSGVPVSMAAKARETKNTATVSLVYTPKDFRKKGYGSLVTALVSERILKDKKACNLHTDLLNPISNSIYQKIGYKKVGESLHLNFES